MVDAGIDGSYFSIRSPQLRVVHIRRVKNSWFGKQKVKHEQAVIVAESFEYYSKLLDRVIVIPRGYVSDGASVPQIFWSIFPPFGIYLLAAIVHDFLCEMAENDISQLTSKYVHLVFREAIEVLTDSVFTRSSMFRAVSWFGPSFDPQVQPHPHTISIESLDVFTSQLTKRAALVR